MNQKNKFKCVSPKGIKNADEQPYTGIFLNILSTVINCTSVKRFCKSFYRRNGLQNRFTEDFGSADYAGGQYISPTS